MGRVTQSEAYRQTFIPLKESYRNNDEQEVYALYDQNKKIDDAFTKLLGQKNWQNIKDLYGLKSIRDELLSSEVSANGLLTFSITINPMDHSEFYIDGQGRFFIIRDRTDEIMLSGDFDIPLQKHFIHDLENGYVVMDVDLYTTRVPERITYVHQVGLKYVIHIDTTLSKFKILAIDYDAKHNVYLIDDSEQDVFEYGELIGEMKLRGVNGAKYIDLRGMAFLRNDYFKKARKANKK
ncbi:MAG TPA: hypothetical protein VKA38_01700 [Draconibacterium sp.]|nr:hypothetical protein [Draconibacterium sp.]